MSLAMLLSRPSGIGFFTSFQRYERRGIWTVARRRSLRALQVIARVKVRASVFVGGFHPTSRFLHSSFWSSYLDTPQSLLAGRFALSARVGADSAVLVVARVPLTFFAAQAAGRDTRVEHLADDLFIRACSAVGERCCRGAHISAIQIQPNALTQQGNPLLGKAAVRTWRARLRARIHLVDGGD
jgi:hypothetical protein